MKTEMAIRSLFISITVIMLAFVVPAERARAAEIGLIPGKQAPAFELTDLSGKTVSLTQFKGKVVLLNFWSTLCGPCVAEMPSLNRLHLSLKDRGFEVLSVAIDASDKPVREFVSAKKIAFTVLVDREKEVFFDDYAGPSLPASYLLDRNGVILETVNGPREWDLPDMKNKVQNALDKR
jgi:peroxiredoxin